MSIKHNSYFLIFLVLLGLFGIIQSLTFRRFEAVVLPILLSSAVFVLASIELSRELRRKDRAQTSVDVRPEREAQAGVGLRRFGSALGWVAGFSLGIYVLGFIIAIPLFVLAYVKRQGQSWPMAIGLAIIVIAFIYGAFQLGLKAPLYRGLVFGG